MRRNPLCPEVLKHNFRFSVNEQFKHHEIINKLKMSMIFISLPSLYKLIFNSVQQNAGVCGLPADLASKPVLSHLSLLLIFHLCGCCGANLRFPNKILWFLSMSKAYLPSYKFKNCSSGDFFIVIDFKILLSFSKRYPLFPLCYRYYHFVYLRIRRFFNT